MSDNSYLTIEIEGVKNELTELNKSIKVLIDVISKANYARITVYPETDEDRAYPTEKDDRD